jgi:hypothetical protein
VSTAGQLVGTYPLHTVVHPLVERAGYLFSGINAGDGLLVVSANNKLVAFR